MGEIINRYNILFGNEGKRPLGRPRRKWEDSAKVEPREIGREGVDWTHMVQDKDHRG
jgi:hypothetical protein